MTRRTRIIAALLLFAGALAVAVPMGRMNAAHRAAYGYAFPDLQDARTEAKAGEILRAWKWTNGTDAVKKAMTLDLAFPLFYAPLLALLAWRAGRFGRAVGLLALFGGLADLGENATMLTMIGGAGAAGVRFTLMRVFCDVKLIALVVAVLYLLFAHLFNERDATVSDVQPDR